MSHSPRSSSFPSVNKQGSILVAAIWVLVFFSILSVAVSRLVFTQIDLLRRIEGWAVSTPLMRSVCLDFRHEYEGRTQPYWSLSDLAIERTREYGIARAAYLLSDEESRININMASAEVLARLPGISPDLAQNIIRSAARPFFAQEQLLLVDGITRAAYDAIKDLITVYSNGKVNINTAPAAVLQALGIDAALAENIVEFRNGADGRAATEDDRIFEQAGEIEAGLKELASMPEPQKVMVLEMARSGLLDVNSQNFTLKATTFILGKKANVYDIVLGRSKILRWQER